MIPKQHRRKAWIGAAGAGWLALGVQFVGGFEGLRTKAYRDVVGVATVCYGETRGVKMGDAYSKDQCDEMLGDGLVEFDDGVNRCIHVELPDKRRVAFVSLAYNIGVGAFCRSSVARRANAGDVRGACDAMLLWNRAGGRVLPGLTRRREAERKLCLEGA